MKESRNGSFLFLRDYMDYHMRNKDFPEGKFDDFSLLYYDDKGKLVAVMPANYVNHLEEEHKSILQSHGGLTFGGLIVAPSTTSLQVKEAIEDTLFHHMGYDIFTHWEYSPAPFFYHRIPSQEDLFWIQQYADEVTYKMGSVIDLREPLHISRRKMTYARRLQAEGYTVRMDASLDSFWPILANNLRDTYSARPVHSLSEITLLQSRFPDNIRCCTVCDPDGLIVGGVVLYIAGHVVRTQYISASPRGKRCNALSLLYTHLINLYKGMGFYYFDFGTSMKDPDHVNDTLLSHKEQFGARGVVYCTYHISK